MSLKNPAPKPAAESSAFKAF